MLFVYWRDRGGSRTAARKEAAAAVDAIPPKRLWEVGAEASVLDSSRHIRARIRYER